MQTGGNDDLRDDANRAASEGEEAVTQGSDVHDPTREGTSQGLDVVTDAEQAGIETHGRTVVDHSHASETHGVDVIDEGPAGTDE